VVLLRAQLVDLESEIAGIKEEEADPTPPATRLLHGGVAADPVGHAVVARRRPTTAAADGLDRRRTAPARAGRLTEELVELRAKLRAAELTLEGGEARALGEGERAELAARVAKLEAVLGTGGAGGTGGGAAQDERTALVGELDWLEGLIEQAERGQAAADGDSEELARLLAEQEASAEAQALTTALTKSRAQLDAALESAQGSRVELAGQVALLSQGDGASGAAPGAEAAQLAEQLDRLAAALAAAGESSRLATDQQEVLAQRLLAAEGDAAVRARELVVLRERLEGSARASREDSDNAALRAGKEKLERELRVASEAAALAEARARRLEAQLDAQTRRAVGGAPPEPRKDDEKPPEYEVRRRIFGGCESATLSRAEALPAVGATDVAELALVWGMDATADVHLMWLPGKALRSPLPPGWVAATDRQGALFYHEASPPPPRPATHSRAR